MSIVDIRIDDRLIHGQVSNFWIPHLGVQKVLIIDDMIVHDTLRKTALKFGCPPSVSLTILSPKIAAEKLLRHADRGARVLILANSPQQLEALLKSGYPFTDITIGNLSNRPNTRPIKKTVYVNQEEIHSLIYLAKKGVRLFAQMIPGEAKLDFTDTILTLGKE